MTNEEILGFDPKQNEYKCFMATIDPIKAQYILDYHNKDNRPFYATQLKALDKSINEDGWCNDGGSMSFNHKGHLTEFQHRLDRIVENGLTVQVPIVVGVVVDTFEKSAPAKKRYPVDQMYRIDKTVVKEDETALRQLLSRRQGEKLNMKNAKRLWRLWKKNVRKGIQISRDIVENTESFKSWNKEILGFTSLMVSIGQEKVAKTLLTLLKNHVHGQETTLTKDFRRFNVEDAGAALDITNTEKSNSRFLLLCAAADKLIEKSDGMIELGLTKGKCNHESMKRKGIYRKFLFDPDKYGTKAYTLIK